MLLSGSDRFQFFRPDIQALVDLIAVYLKTTKDLPEGQFRSQRLYLTA